MLFQYTHLAKDSIRLVQFLPYSTPENIFLSLEHHPEFFSKPNNERYTAVWYTHHNDDSNHRKPITLHGRAFMIPETLWSALSAIVRGRSKDPLGSEKFWIDATCINQRDPQENMEQSEQLCKIYSCAASVLLWLGECRSESPSDFSIHELASSSLMKDFLEQSRVPGHVQILRDTGERDNCSDEALRTLLSGEGQKHDSESKAAL